MGDTLPHTFRRLIARKVGPSFRSVAEIEEVPMKGPEGDQVLLLVAQSVEEHCAAASGDR